MATPKNNGGKIPTLPKSLYRIADKIRGVRLAPKQNLPRPKQILFVKHLFKTGSPRKAYEAAGYSSIGHYTNDSYKYKAVQRVLHGKAVQFLIRLTMADWCLQNQVNAHRLADMALQAYDNAPNVRDQLEAVKLLAHLAGYQTLIDIDHWRR